MARVIRRRFPKRKIICYPDPTGKALKTSSGGVSDHAILRAYNFTLRYRNKYPTHKDLANEMNAALGDKPFPPGLPKPPGYIQRPPKLFVSPKCRTLIQSWKKLVWVPEKDPPTFDKTRGWDHPFDASAFPVHYEWPIDVRGEVGSHDISY